MDEKLQDKYVENLKDCNSGDIEGDHSRADDYLCDLLNELGYYKVTAEWEKVEKWYA